MTVRAEDVDERIRLLVDEWDLRLRETFLSIVVEIRDSASLEEIAVLLETGQIDAALEAVIVQAGVLAADVNAALIASGSDMAVFLRTEAQVPAVFDVTHDATVRAMRDNQLRLVSGFTQEQVATTRTAIADGIARGANPLDQARAFRDSIGLTTRQWEAVQSYREALERGSSEALNRELRDRRFDRMVRRAARGGRPLTADQIDRAVTRYTERWIKYRSEVIARTEALRAVHQGREAALQQAVDAGNLLPEEMTSEWNTAADSKVRDSHRSMSGQLRPHGVAFLSGRGNLLRYPGDIDAPAADTIQCRCAVSTRIIPIAEQQSAIQRTTTDNPGG